MTTTLRTPKKLLNALKDKGVTLKHLQIRRGKGLIKPAVEAGKKGTSNKYGTRDSLLYVAATLLESLGYSMERAFQIAASTIDNLHIVAALINEHDVWLIETESGNESATAMNMHEIENEFQPEYMQDKVRLIPMPGVLLLVPKEDFSNRLGGKDTVLSIEYRNLSAIIQDAFCRLKMGIEERRELFKGKVDISDFE